jgi:hypothetical protein
MRKHKSNPAMKGVGTRQFGSSTYYYAGRTIYPTKALSVATDLLGHGIDTKLTKSKGMETFLWTKKPIRVDLGEVGSYGLYNPRRRSYAKRNPQKRQVLGLVAILGFIGYLIYKNK